MRLHAAERTCSETEPCTLRIGRAGIGSVEQALSSSLTEQPLSFDVAPAFFPKISSTPVSCPIPLFSGSVHPRLPISEQPPLPRSATFFDDRGRLRQHSALREGVLAASLSLQLLFCASTNATFPVICAVSACLDRHSIPQQPPLYHLALLLQSFSVLPST